MRHAIGMRAAVYTRTAVVLHWLVGLALVGEFGFGLALREVARGSPSRGPLVNLHKSIGIALGIAILARLAWRATHRPPALPPTVARWQAAAARANHAVMYACMVVIPLSGYVASNFSKYGVKVLGRVVFAPWGPDRPEVYAFFNGLHDWAAWLLAGLVAVHVLAALEHAWIARDGPFARLTLRRRAPLA